MKIIDKLKDDKKKEWIQKNKWKLIGGAALLTLGGIGAGIAISKVHSPITINNNLGNDLLKALGGTTWANEYLNAQLSMEELLDDPTAIMMIGEEAISSGTITTDQANQLLSTNATKILSSNPEPIEVYKF